MLIQQSEGQFKLITSKDGMKQTHTHKIEIKPNQSSLGYTKNSVSHVVPDAYNYYFNMR